MPVGAPIELRRCSADPFDPQDGDGTDDGADAGHGVEHTVVAAADRHDVNPQVCVETRATW